MKALLLGAGYGSRLYPLTKDRPKPLLPVAGKPVLEWILEQLSSIEALNEVFLVSNHRFADAYRDWQTSYRGPKPVRILDDGTTSIDDRKGAVGDLQFVLEETGCREDLLVIAGDNLFRFDTRDLVQFFLEKGATIAVKDLGSTDLVSQFSVVEVEASGRVTDFQEKPPLPRSSLIAICFYAFPAETLPLVGEYLAGGGNPDAPGYYIQWLVRRTPVYAYVLNGSWFDIGDIDSYTKANGVFSE